MNESIHIIAMLKTLAEREVREMDEAFERFSRKRNTVKALRESAGALMTNDEKPEFDEMINLNKALLRDTLESVAQIESACETLQDLAVLIADLEDHFN